MRSELEAVGGQIPVVICSRAKGWKVSKVLEGYGGRKERGHGSRPVKNDTIY